MTRILVTGGCGLIGSNLVKRLTELPGHDIVVADNLWRGRLENLEGGDGPVIDIKSNFFKVDLRDYDECVRVSEGVDVIFHLADLVAGINFVFDNEYSIFRANNLINSNVLHAACENEVGKYIYVGSACSYPAEKQAQLNPPPFKEEDAYPAHPESAYGWSKLMGEYECELAQKEGRIDVGVLRLHNVYGSPCELSPERSQVIPALCRKAILNPEEPFVVWGSGAQRRAFVFVSDVVDALLAVWERGMNEGVIQIGPGLSHSIRQIAESIVGISGKDISIAYDTSRREGDMDRTADWSKAKRTLGWSPTVSLEDGLRLTYEWCKRYLRR